MFDETGLRSYLFAVGCDFHQVAFHCTEQDQVFYIVHAQKGLFYFRSFFMWEVFTSSLSVVLKYFFVIADIGIGCKGFGFVIKRIRVAKIKRGQPKFVFSLL